MSMFDKFLRFLGIETHEERLESMTNAQNELNEAIEEHRRVSNEVWKDRLRASEERTSNEFWDSFSRDTPYIPPDRYLYEDHDRDEMERER